MLKKPAIVTSLSIAGIVLAGGAAVGATVGILNAGDNNPMGTLSAEADIATTAPSTSPGSSTTTAASTTSTRQRFAVEKAGEVEVLNLADKLTLGKTLPAPGWRAAPGTTTPTSVEVTFTSGADKLVFTATLGADGTVSGAATRPGQPAQPATLAAATPPSAERGDDHEDKNKDHGADHDNDHDGHDEDHGEDDDD